MSELFNKQVKKGEERSSINPISVNTADGKKMIYDISPKTLTGMSMKQINTKGKSFPMVQPNEMMQQKEMMQPINRAGRPADSNILTNDPNIPQPPNKVPASMNNRNQMFNSIASDQGQPYTPTFGMYDGPSKALVGDQDKLPQHLQQAILDSPGMFGKEPRGTKEEMAERKIQKRNIRVKKRSEKDLAKLDKKFDKISAKKKAGKITQALAEQKIMETGEKADRKSDKAKYILGSKKDAKAFAKAKKAKPFGMYDDGMSMHGMNHAHTHVTSKNVKFAEKDDAAHIDYLKRDINYDSKHGGSNKQMTDDEKHISKLAGDIKYDHKHHGRKYDNV